MSSSNSSSSSSPLRPRRRTTRTRSVTHLTTHSAATALVDERIDAAGDHLVDVQEVPDVFCDVLHLFGDLLVLRTDSVHRRREVRHLVFEFVDTVGELCGLVVVVFRERVVVELTTTHPAELSEVVVVAVHPTEPTVVTVETATTAVVEVTTEAATTTPAVLVQQRPAAAVVGLFLLAEAIQEATPDDPEGGKQPQLGPR
jgi:hypothetical protein